MLVRNVRYISGDRLVLQVHCITAHAIISLFLFVQKMYADEGVEYLLDNQDTVHAYEERGKKKNGGSSQYDQAMDALKQMDRVNQMEAILGSAYRILTVLPETELFLVFWKFFYLL